jgi:hypothetical protein
MTLFAHLTAAALLLWQPAPTQKPPVPSKTPSVTAPKPAPTDLMVTLTYKGKGTVDANHRLLAWLFADPNVTSASRPIGSVATTAKNGDTVTFKDVPNTPVYVFVAYDSKGGYDGVSGPPPAGIPTAFYSMGAMGAPAPVKAGGPALKVTFDDSQPWNK